MPPRARPGPGRAWGTRRRRSHRLAGLLPMDGGHAGKAKGAPPLGSRPPVCQRRPFTGVSPRRSPERCSDRERQKGADGMFHRPTLGSWDRATAGAHGVSRSSRPSASLCC